MISVIINSWKEPKNIGKAIKCIANPRYSGISNDFEIIQVSPDQETLSAGKAVAQGLGLGSKFIQIKDPLKGKPYALKTALSQAKGEILILTDGDVYFDKGAVKRLVFPLLKNPKVGAATGRPISLNGRNTMFGYFSQILTDSAHHRRTNLLANAGEYLITTKNFFPMSGYIIATRNIVDLPADVLSDDAYISYEIRNKGYQIAYVPDALVYVKYPTNLKDYLRQKVRSIGGYTQLKKYGVMKKDYQSRSFWIELQYALFVLTYGRNLKEFIWSLVLFPLRLYTWILIFYKRTLLKEGMPEQGWERIESTK